MASDKLTRRQTYSEALKVQVLAECAAPGASVAKVALGHGINANVVHRWRQLVREGMASVPAIPSGFVPVSLTAPAAPPISIAEIQVELRRGAIALTTNWPTSAAAEFAAWTRELLR